VRLIWIAVFVVVVLAITSAAQAQTTFVVNSDRDLGDQLPGDGQCDTGAQIGLTAECTLRAALHEANRASEAVRIEFWEQIETDLGWTIIEVGSGGLPPIENEVEIAGETHPNFDPDIEAPRVVLQSVSTTDTIHGLSLSGDQASNSVIRAISILGFTGNGISISGGNDHLIEGVSVGARWKDGGLDAIDVNGNGQNGIRISGGTQGTLIRNSYIVDSGSHGILIALCTLPPCAENIEITGNKIGLAPPFDGNLRPARNGGTGILIGGNNGTNSIGGLAPANIIASNQSNGIEIYSDDQIIQNNFIGIPPDPDTPTGTDPEDYGNGDFGILISSSDNQIGGTITAPFPGSSFNVPNRVGNVGIASIRIDDQDGPGFETNSNIIDYNLIGTDAAGNDYGDTDTTGVSIMTGSGNTVRNATIHHHYTGIAFSSRISPFDPQNVAYANDVQHAFNAGVLFFAIGRLGGPNASDANIIGNSGTGVRIQNTTDTCCVEIFSNYIGTDEDGNDLGNSNGIHVSGTNQVDIGSPGSGNIIGHNTRGIVLSTSASDTWIRGNRIGIHPSGGAIGNDTGIQFYSSSSSNVSDAVVGYSSAQTIDPENWAPGQQVGNFIAYNTEAGVDLSGSNDSTLGNSIRGNRFLSNNGNAIDLGMDGPDETGGSATGPNKQMNFPEFDAAVTQFDSANNEIIIRYRVDIDTSNAAYPLGVDFYLTDDDSNEGFTFIGTDDYQSADAGSWKVITIDVPSGVQVWNNLTATATDIEGNTSEFSHDPVLLRERTDRIFHDRFEELP